ncbi:hypothetical protein BUALT_Bualt13G0019100 [Buddleja alternifolia]|uniref:Cystatin domain-containing protein n=1 Tax=Buddleja alternifolia TaxID=168488 RepID=A0AAV6WUU3_9LAMI|nr:hypothetical protein BUALT_Bualt13G0019100 [Buddleja alternifolia]
MAFKSLPLLFVLISIFVASISYEVIATGEYQPIPNLNDPLVVASATFAVNEYNKQVKTKLEFVSISQGEYQVVNGINYKLDIVARNGINLEKYEAIVNVKPRSTKPSQLLSFKKV